MSHPDDVLVFDIDLHDIMTPPTHLRPIVTKRISTPTPSRDDPPPETPPHAIVPKPAICPPAPKKTTPTKSRVYRIEPIELSLDKKM